MCSIDWMSSVDWHCSKSLETKGSQKHQINALYFQGHWKVCFKLYVASRTTKKQSQLSLGSYYKFLIIALLKTFFFKVMNCSCWSLPAEEFKCLQESSLQFTCMMICITNTHTHIYIQNVQNCCRLKCWIILRLSPYNTDNRTGGGEERGYRTEEGLQLLWMRHSSLIGSNWKPEIIVQFNSIYKLHH